MSEALYRKHRPQKFDDVVGQDDVVSTLSNSLKKGTHTHSYIFAGTRGTGKTTIARIFAKLLGTSDNDLYEIDAASNRGIDEIRAVRDAVVTLPFDSKYKIYILDEAHMLTREAWNALLKTLEEPPSHVIFIMATTELDKIPETIISRSEVYHFKTPDPKTLESVLLTTAKKEGFSISPQVASMLALVADGSFRDAHGVLQKVLSSAQGKSVELKDIEHIVHLPKTESIHRIIKAIIVGDVQMLLASIRDVFEARADKKIFIRLLLQEMRLLVLLRVDPSFKDILASSLSKDHYDFLTTEASNAKTKDIINSASLERLIISSDSALRSAFPEIMIEMMLLSFIKQ